MLQRQHQAQAKEVGRVQQRLGHLGPQLDRPGTGFVATGQIQRGHPLTEAALDHRGDQVVLVGEVPVDGGRG